MSAWLVASTLPHYLAIIPLNRVEYRTVIFISSSLSVLWHLRGEEQGILLNLDYMFAGIWFAYDIWLGYRLVLKLRTVL